MTLAAPSSGAGGELKTRQVDQLQYLSNTHVSDFFNTLQIFVIQYFVSMYKNSPIKCCHVDYDMNCVCI